MKKLITLLILSGLMSVTYARTTELTVYKDANCGCCGAWVKYMENAGYKVRIVDVQDISKVKEKYNVPKSLQSCHTSVVNSTGQIIEGHVPLKAVEKMLENPKLKGVAVPGMQANSPGMGNMNGQLKTLTLNGEEFSKD